MIRRAFIEKSSRMGLLVCTASTISLPWTYANTKKDYYRAIATKINFSPRPVPENKRIPLSWKTFAVNAEGAHTILTFAKSGQKEMKVDKVFLRVTPALDFREEIQLMVSIAGSGREIGIFDIKYAHPFQPFDFPIPKNDLTEISKNGIALRRLSGQNDSWFFGSDDNRKDNLALQPQLLCGKEPGDLEGFDKILYSMNSFATFGWIGGCVIDALFEEHRRGNDTALRTLQHQLSKFLDNEKGIIFESPNTVPLDGTYNSIEDFLPMAAIVHLYPRHISINKALEFLMQRKDENGLIRSNDITTEGCYTVAYPLAAIAAVRKDKELAKIAMEQLLHRTDHLTVEGAIYQRKNQNGISGFRNWSRGAAWYFLGMIKTIIILERNFKEDFDLKDLKKSFKKHSAWVLSLQRKEGLWNGFLDQPETSVDTSASAGIATAFVLGYQHGVLEADYLESGQRCFVALKNHLSIDGFLKGVSQINRGGEKLQASDYRVMSQFGLGLMAQLRTAINKV